MTNLEIIKYLSTNNPARLAELLDDIYCIAWNNGSYAGSNGEGKILEECEIDDFNEWIKQDAAESGFYFDEELEQWSNAINHIPTIEATYDNLTVTIPVGDPDHMWNKNNEYDYKMEAVDTAIDEIKLLETLVNVNKYSDSVYNSFRKEVCAGCNDPNCLKSQVEIYDCHKFENYFEV